MLTKAPRGTGDVISPDSCKWQYIEGKARDICKRFGFGEIRTPTFEHTELFLRGVGDTTDVVEKQMYTFEDKGKRSITLRPEGTASAARAYIEHNLSSQPLPIKLFYTIPCFRYEKPQAGRLREFHQFGVEVFGSANPTIDVEIISLAVMFLNELGLDKLSLNINSIGCPECRKKYNEILIDYFKKHTDELCDTCKGRLERNPLRILDCKSPICGALAKDAPKLIDYICDECKEHFEAVKTGLDTIGISYKVDPDIVRGLDYYTKTVFEITSNEIGSQSAVCGGGRYDGLIEELGGAPSPGIGFALGIERLIMVMENKGLGFGDIPVPALFVANIGEKAGVYAEKLIYDLRKKGIICEKDRIGRSLKAQMKYADKMGYKYTVVLGDDEINNNEVSVKNMNDGTQINVALDKLDEYLEGER